MTENFMDWDAYNAKVQESIIQGLIDGFGGFFASTKWYWIGLFAILFLKNFLPIVFRVLRNRKYAQYGFAEIDQMNGGEFERYCGVLLKKLGYREISYTPASGDYGIDILAKDAEGQSVGFQCKRYKSKVGNKAIQEAYSGKSYYELDRVNVITNNFFTENARKTAAKNRVGLIDRKLLLKWIEKSRNAADSSKVSE